MSESERDDWMSPGEAARRVSLLYPRYSVTKTAVIRWAHKGEIPSQRYRGRFLLVRLADVIAYNVPASELGKAVDEGVSQGKTVKVE